MPRYRGGYWGSDPNYAPTPQEEKSMLNEDAQALEAELNAIKSRLAELRGQSKK